MFFLKKGVSGAYGYQGCKYEPSTLAWKIFCCHRNARVCDLEEPSDSVTLRQNVNPLGTCLAGRISEYKELFWSIFAGVKNFLILKLWEQSFVFKKG